MSRPRVSALGFLAVVASAVVGCAPSGADHSDVPDRIDIGSPNGGLEMRIRVDAGGLDYDVVAGAEFVLQSSALAVTFNEADFTDGVRIVDPGSSVDEVFKRSLPGGKQRDLRADATTRTITVENAAGDRLALDIVVFDSAVAHRFRQIDDTAWTVSADTSSFVFDAASTKFVQANDRPGTFTPAAEAFYSAELEVGTQFPSFTGWALPALFRTGDRWTLLAETAVGGAQDGSVLHNESGSPEYVLQQPDGNPRNRRQEEGPPAEHDWRFDGLPWKVIVSSDDLADIVADSTTSLLAEPTQLEDTHWIRPGRVSWSWWSDSNSPTDPDALRDHIDVAAEFGWEYSLIDANWNLLDTQVIAGLVEYAREREVGIFLWYNSGGAHNEVTEQPRDRMVEPDRRRAEMAWLREIGVAGVKVDFFHSDRRSMNAYALDILRDATDHRLLVNFHGITSPKGWHATFPNLMTTEAVRGAEQYKFDPRFPELAPRQNTVLAFTRNVVGPMDYTPVTLSSSTFPSRTTEAHELALGVVFESALQHLADSASSYRQLDELAQDYLSRLPVVWDETVLLLGRPADHVVLARRHGEEWWIGGINGTDATLTLEVDLRALDGLRPMHVIDDGRTVDGPVDERQLTVELAPAGGFVAWPA